MRVVLADDEQVIREGISQHIDWESLQCELVGVACDGLEALEFVRLYHPEIVITDIRMPEMDGLELLRAIHFESPQTNVIILSAYREFELAQEAMKYGVRSYLLKPANKEDISEAIRKAIQEYSYQFKKGKYRENEIGKDELSINWDKLTHPGVRKTVNYILERHTDPNLSLDRIANEIVSHNPDYLSRRFKSETGKSFSSFLSLVRITHAMKLIKTNPSYTNADLARLVGYHDNSGYFSSAFAKTAGMSVRDYRAKVLL